MRAALALPLLLTTACLAPTNPFDPGTPAGLQARATLKGTIRGAAGPLPGASFTVGEESFTTEEPPV